MEKKNQKYKLPLWLARSQKCWVCDQKSQQPFRKAIIQNVSYPKILIKLQNSRLQQTKLEALQPRSASTEYYTDLMDIDILNNPELLYHIKRNFLNKNIYTYVGPTLLITNPYKYYQELYTKQKRRFYIENLTSSSILLTNKEFQPHIYGIVAQAIKILYQSKKNQSILISGESGAGKTQANKECMRFIAQFFSSNNEQQSLQDKILSCNPILEAFGNAKTIRNDNSSRFGKFIQIQINMGDKKIIKAIILNYLLEKSRVTSQLEQQRNFHIFYYFLYGISNQQKIKYGIPNQFKLSDFQYLKNTNLLSSDGKMLKQIQKALLILHFQDIEDSVWRVLASILHFGNLKFEQQIKEQVNCQLININVLENICDLLQINKQNLLDGLTCKKIKVNGQEVSRSQSQKQIRINKDSLSRSLYQKLFSWLVTSLNKALTKQKLSHVNIKSLKTIGLLDIYGFQVLKINSFEQLCINFTNQRLHQLYIQQVFKAEKKILQDEGLGNYLGTIQFKDNQALLDMLDFNTVSVFNLLDEQCSIATADEKSFLTKIKFNHKKNQYFPAINLNSNPNSNMLIIKHTPREVEYNVSNFQQKNKNFLKQNLLQVLKQSKLLIILEMFADNGIKQTNFSSNSNKIKKFLGSKFRSQMNQLTKQLQNLSDLHFIRCIKSNNNKQQQYFDNKVALEQIKYLGILQSIKMRRQSYCIRIPYDSFCNLYKWYRQNYTKKIDQFKFKDQTQKILKNYFQFLTKDDLLFGHTKLFLKDNAYFQIKQRYKIFYDKLKSKAHKIISLFIKNKYMRKRKYKKILKSYIQTFAIQIKRQRIKKAVIILQRAYRKKQVQMNLKQYRKKTITLQSYFRTSLQMFNRQSKILAVRKIQRFFRNRIKKQFILSYGTCLKIFYQKILFQSWLMIRIRTSLKLTKYINTFACLIRNKQNIQTFKYHAYIKQQYSNIRKIQKYIKSVLQRNKYLKYMGCVRFLQSQYRTKVLRQNFKNLRKSAIIIQKFYRKYFFEKVQSHEIFQKFFQPYNSKLKLNNQKIRSILFGSRKSKQDDQLYVDDIIRSYLGKFHHKMNIFYYMIDIQNFIDLNDVYSNNSWIKNYLKLLKDSFQKNTFIQQVKIAQTFTVCSTSNKLYTWGGVSFNNQKQIQINLKGKVFSFNIKRDQLQIHYQNSKSQKNEAKYYYTVKKSYKFNQFILYQNKKEGYVPYLMKSPEKIIQIACGNGHVICRTYLKKILTWGYGKQGQLGHGQYFSEQKPKQVLFFQKNLSLFVPLQISASFSSSIVLLSNRKIYWFGKNGTINNIATPTQLILLQKNSFIGNPQLFTPLKIISSWSRTQSVIGLSMLSLNNVLEKNIGLRNKIANMIIIKWEEVGIESINPPFIKSLINYLAECNVKMPISKPMIQMQSKRVLRELEQQINNVFNENLEVRLSENYLQKILR